MNIDKDFYYETKRKSNWKIANDLCKLGQKEGWLDNNDFSEAINSLLVSTGGYVIDTGCGAQVNAVILEDLIRKIKKHPILWRLFFMVA